MPYYPIQLNNKNIYVAQYSLILPQYLNVIKISAIEIMAKGMFYTAYIQKRLFKIHPNGHRT